MTDLAKMGSKSFAISTGATTVTYDMSNQGDEMMEVYVYNSSAADLAVAVAPASAAAPGVAGSPMGTAFPAASTDQNTISANAITGKIIPPGQGMSWGKGGFKSVKIYLVLSAGTGVAHVSPVTGA